MLKGIEKIKLKSLLIILVCLAISIVILLQIVYLSWFHAINKQNYSDFLQETLKQIEMKAITFLKEINNVANTISYNEIIYQFIHTAEISEQLKLKNNLQVMIESIILSNSNINDIIITDLDLINIGAYRGEGFWVLQQMKSKHQQGLIQFDKPAHYVLEGHPGGKPFYVCVTKSFDAPGTNGQFITVIVYNTDSFIDFVSNLQPKDNSVLVILDPEGNVIAANRQDRTTWDGMADARYAGDKHSKVYQRTVGYLNWTIIGYTPGVEMNRDLSALKQFGILTAVIVVIVFVGFGFMINRSLMTPIIKMARFMNAAGQNYQAQRLVIHHANEISLLAKALNTMLDNIDAMNKNMAASQEKLYKAELARKHAQFSAFQSQVNPHFLYNTLDCIRSIALARNVPEIFDITTAMAKIFRYSIKENHYVMAGDELECIQEYFKIIQIRQRNRFSIVYDVDESIKACIIPKMILQPVVENAVFHGLEQKKGRGTLIVKGHVSGNDTLVFEIKDDGKGMASDALQELQKRLAAGEAPEDTSVAEKKSLGLINIDRRIKLLYGTEYGLTIDSDPREGTTVRILLPLERKNRKSSNISENSTFQ